MDSPEHPIDKARRIQEERIKADRNYFVTWDRWIPPKLWPTPFPQKSWIPVGLNTFPIPPKRPIPPKAKSPIDYPTSLMPSRKKSAAELAKQYFGHEQIDMCWDIEADEVPKVATPTASASANPESLAEVNFGNEQFDTCWGAEEDGVPKVVTPTASASAEQQFGSEKFEMLWGTEVDEVPQLVTPTASTSAELQFGNETYDMGWDGEGDPAPTDSPTQAAGQYDLCWDDAEDAPTYDMCWDDAESAPTVAGAVLAAADMPWEDPSASAADFKGECRQSMQPTVDLGEGPSTGPVTSGRSGISPVVSSALRNRSPSEILTRHEELLRRADERLQTIDALMGQSGQLSPDVTDADRHLISSYRDARDRFAGAREDIARIEHMMTMANQVNDPLIILQLGLKKMGSGKSTAQ
ncbi:hypothetical protein DEU56DRAFT_920377 [Suillus clintonianus]|uniref:uncharacterized protein n=1 Tax=Suillus clintonianus TaxID=1904413 RepID=UPI001B87FB19|nr:uncharacterized protein DEU56DRAFT_920377 [Suillus clintonianus]KAG2109219.1 hypothetical protein DEU56DRAFT_920377 [Suillus clintonianus]